MKKVSAFFCECCREFFDAVISNSTKNDMCVKCNKWNDMPEEDWVVTKID